jgi:MFS family permease
LRYINAKPGFDILKKSRLFYGYWVLVACFIFNIIGSGCGPISFSFFVTSLEKSLDWSRTEIMTAFTLFFVCSAISAPFAGRLVHRFGGRRVMALGALSACIGYILISQMNDLWQYYVGYAIIGSGFAAIGPVTTTLLVSNWFRRRRGMAIGMMSMGPGISAMIFTPLVIVYLLPNFGWSISYIVFAAVTGGIGIPIGLFLIRNEPADMGLLPDGRESPDVADMTDAGSPTAGGLSFRMALGTQAFWLLAVAILFLNTHMGVMQNQIPHLEDLAFSAGIVASVMTIVAVMSAIGTLIFGWLCDKIQVKTASVIGLVLIALSIAILTYIDASSSVWLIWTYATLLGLGIGGFMPAMSILTSTNFGLAAYGTIYGMLHFFQSVGAATGPLLAGYMYDTRGSYQWAFIIIVILVVVAIPLVLSVRRPTSYPSPVT